MIDTHCHLIDPQFSADCDQVVGRARAAGVTCIINAGYDLATSLAAVAMQRRHDWLLPAVGIHPNECAGMSLGDLDKIEDLIRIGKVYALGETGLDYYRERTAVREQHELFRRQIRIARKYGLPLLIHTRNSIEDAMTIVKEEDYCRGIFHCYSGTAEQALSIIDLGFALGFGGVLTFSKKTREVLRRVPVSSVVLETDAPFLAPTAHRGGRNEPAYLEETLRTAAAVLGMSPHELEAITDENARALFPR